MKEHPLDRPLTGTTSTSARTRFTLLVQQGWAELLGRQELTVFLLLLVMGSALSFGTDTFFTATNLLNVAIYVSWFAIAAFGVGVAIIVGGVDLSVGSVMALAGLVCALALQNGVNPVMAVTLGAGVGVLVGVVNGTLVGYYRLPPFIVTLGTMGLARGITLGLTEGAPVRELPSAFRWLGQGELLIGSFAIPLPVLWALGLALLVSLILQRTVLGHYIYTVARDEPALRFTGVPTQRVKLLAYTLSSLLAALGGIVMTAKLGVAAPMAALGYELDIIAAAVIGGVSLFGGEGSVIGIVIGTVLMQIARNGLVLVGLPTFWQWLTIGMVILVVILFDYWRRRREL